jgi:hypothetical protein
LPQTSALFGFSCYTHHSLALNDFSAAPNSCAKDDALLESV